MRITLVISLFFISLFGWTQKAEISIDKNTIVIGEQTVLRIFFEYQNPRGEALVGWPHFDKTLTKKIEIIDKTVDYESLHDSLTQTYRREQQLTITSFEPGDYVIPAMEIELDDVAYKTNELQLLVNTVEVDTSKGIVDIKPKFEVEYTFGERAGDWFKDNWHWLVTAAVLVALFLLFRLWKKRRQEQPEPEAPKIPAHITALAALNNLLQDEGWKQENKKEYYSRLTDTVRLYLEERFDIYAMEETTREILADLKKADINDADKSFLRQILNQADMVKFAKFNPSDEDGFISLSKSIEFVERTKIEEEKSEEKNE